jgi:hypothetical protein
MRQVTDVLRLTTYYSLAAVRGLVLFVAGVLTMVSDVLDDLMSRVNHVP